MQHIFELSLRLDQLFEDLAVNFAFGVCKHIKVIFLDYYEFIIASMAIKENGHIKFGVMKVPHLCQQKVLHSFGYIKLFLLVVDKLDQAHCTEVSLNILE